MRASRVVVPSSVALILLVAGCGLGGGSTATSSTAKKSSSATTTFATVPVPATTVPPSTVASAVLPSGVSQIPGQTVVGAIPKPTDRYIVKQGDLLANIAKAMGVTLDQLLNANGLTLVQANTIQVGTKLAVPDGGRMPPGGDSETGAPAGNSSGVVPTTVGPAGPISAFYTVQSGDAWISIASRLKVDLAQLYLANNASAETLIVPGQKIKVPGKTQAQVNAATTVKAATTTIKQTTTTKKPVAST